MNYLCIRILASYYLFTATIPSTYQQLLSSKWKYVYSFYSLTQDSLFFFLEHLNIVQHQNYFNSEVKVFKYVVWYQYTW